MLANWGSDILERTDVMTLLHRVVLDGNHLESVQDLAWLLGLRVIVEG